jgi:hypothetical protein
MIKVSQDYSLYVNVTPLKPDNMHLKIESTRLGAKNPDEKQVLYSVTLPRQQMAQLGGIIQEGCSK